MDKEFFKKKFLLLKNADALLQKRNETATQLHYLLQQGTMQLEEEIETKRKELLVLDHTLDLLTEDDCIDKKAHLDEMGKQLTALFPESQEKYSSLKTELEQNEKMTLALSSIDPYITKYCSHFKQAAALLARGKKRSLFSTLFGRHPKVLLSYEVNYLAKEAAKDLKKIQNLPKSYIEEIQQELLKLLQELVEEANKRWNKELYEKSFYLFLEKAEKLQEKSNTLLKECAQRLASLEDEILDYMIYFCDQK